MHTDSTERLLDSRVRLGHLVPAKPTDAIREFVDNVTETLGLDKKKFGLLPFAAEEKTQRETVEVE